MKANTLKRKIFDAVDLLTEETSAQMMTAGGVEALLVDSIIPFHAHSFHLYEGECLDDMVKNVQEHGILAPVIVRKHDDICEMLASHNRLNAARIVGLTEILGRYH